MTEKFEQLSAEEQQQLLEKYDPEAATRKLKGPLGWIAFFGLLSFSLFQLYASIFQTIPKQILLSIHLGFALSLIFLLFPARKNIFIARRRHREYPFVAVVDRGRCIFAADAR